jgi:hypothetical protein
VSEILRQIEQARTAQQENEQRHDVQLEIEYELRQVEERLEALATRCEAAAERWGNFQAQDEAGKGMPGGDASISRLRTEMFSGFAADVRKILREP